MTWSLLRGQVRCKKIDSAVPACLNISRSNVSEVLGYGFLPDAVPHVRALPWFLADAPARSDEVRVTPGVREGVRGAARASTTGESGNPLLLLFLHLVLLPVSQNLWVEKRRRKESEDLQLAKIRHKQKTEEVM